jgi:hypothetical protein
MEPKTVTITDEVAYQSYLSTQANGWLLDISQITHDLADASVDGDQVEQFSTNVEALLAQLMESGLTAYLRENTTGHARVAEYKEGKGT